MSGRRRVLRKIVPWLAVVLASTTLTGCHELYCGFVEGLTGVPLDCSHDAFPDLGDIELPPLPPPPSLPTTTTSTVVSPTTSSIPTGPTTSFVIPTTSSSVLPTTSPTSPTGPSTTQPG